MQKPRNLPRDTNSLAARIVAISTEQDAPLTCRSEDVKGGAAGEIRRKGGLNGGKARAAKLTPQQRSEIAKIAASARWKKD